MSKGNHIAIINGKIVARGDSPLEVYNASRKKYPKIRPLLSYTGSTDVSF